MIDAYNARALVRKANTIYSKIERAAANGESQLLYPGILAGDTLAEIEAHGFSVRRPDGDLKERHPWIQWVISWETPTMAHERRQKQRASIRRKARV